MKDRQMQAGHCHERRRLQGNQPPPTYSRHTILLLKQGRLPARRDLGYTPSLLALKPATSASTGDGVKRGGVGALHDGGGGRSSGAHLRLGGSKPHICVVWAVVCLVVRVAGSRGMQPRLGCGTGEGGPGGAKGRG